MTVLVGEATQRAAARAIAFEPAGEQASRARPPPSPRGGPCGSSPTSAAASTPTSSRHRSWAARMSCAWSRTCSTRRPARARPRLVSVIGPAGIGKTRLAWEFLRYLDGLVDTVWYHDGRSPAYGDGISFWALGEMVRRRAGLLETDDEATTRAKVAEMLADARAGRRRAAMDRARPPGPPGGGDRGQPGAALRGLADVLRAARRDGARSSSSSRTSTTPTPGLIDFVDHLVEWSRGHADLRRDPVPPGAARATAGLGGRQAQLRQPEPGAAPAGSDARAPGRARARVCPTRRPQAIIARADGIPLYAVETVRMLVAEGRLVMEGDVYVPAATSTTLAVPETLTALIASRLDALAPADRRPGPGRGCARPELHPGRPWRRSREPARRRSSRGCGPWCGARSWPPRTDPRSTGARPVRASSRRSSARSPTARWRRPTARPNTWLRRGTAAAGARAPGDPGRPGRPAQP